MVEPNVIVDYKSIFAYWYLLFAKKMISGFRQYFPSPLEQSHIPGGYCYANLQMNTPAIADKTIVRIITKQLLLTRINLRLIDIN